MTDFMTDLNLSLWIAGATVILGVIVYNFWQEHKAKKNIERAFGEYQDDVLMQAEEKNLNSDAHEVIKRQEPTLDVQADAINSTSLDSTSVVIEKEIGKAAVEITSSEMAHLPVDEFIDCVISMEFETPTRGDKIINEVQSFRRVGKKPVHFIGTNTEGRREVITPAASYTYLLAGVPFVTRSGAALNELEYSELVMKLRQISDNLNAHPDIPDMKHVMDAGRDLHLFVTEHDAQLSVNVKAKGAPWGISSLLASLEKHGFDTQPNGRLVMLDGEGGALYTLHTNCGVSEQTTSRITLLLDVPCVAPSRGGFSSMVSCAKSLALRLGGSLVDDGNELLNDATLEQIQEQVDSFYRSMQAAEIPAGSIRAVRIFS